MAEWKQKGKKHEKTPSIYYYVVWLIEYGGIPAAAGRYWNNRNYIVFAIFPERDDTVRNIQSTLRSYCKLFWSGFVVRTRMVKHPCSGSADLTATTGFKNPKRGKRVLLQTAPLSSVRLIIWYRLNIVLSCDQVCQCGGRATIHVSLYYMD